MDTTALAMVAQIRAMEGLAATTGIMMAATILHHRPL
jgi:hypothetical protein